MLSLELLDLAIGENKIPAISVRLFDSALGQLTIVLGPALFVDESALKCYNFVFVGSVMADRVVGVVYVLTDDPVKDQSAEEKE